MVSGGIGVREKPCAGYWVAKQCSTLHQQPWNDLARQVPPGGPLPDPDARALEQVRALSAADFGASGVVFADDGTFPGVTE